MCKVKVQFTLEQTMKTQRGEQMHSCTLPSTSVLYGGGWSMPRPIRFTPRERPSTHHIGGWLGPGAGLDWCGKSRPPPGFDPRTIQSVASCYTNYAILPPVFCMYGSKQ